MHKRILLVLDRDQFKPFDYSMERDAAFISMGSNSGNGVFQYALQALLTNNGNEVLIDDNLLHRTFRPDDAYFGHINSNFDVLVFSPANMISCFPSDLWSTRLENIKIPIIAIGLGAQTSYDYDLAFLTNIKDKASRFINSILKNGGYIGTRGEFTSECLKILGYKEGEDYQTIGCPSLFLHGDNLNIDTPNLGPEKLRIAFNGFTFWNMEDQNFFMKKYPNSIFICQDEFYNLLYKPMQLTWKELQYLNNQSDVFLSNYLGDRIKFYGDFPSWCNDMREHNINFSFGCRIHGNIVALLNKIPCHLDIIDSRIRELSEYFNIPGTRFDHKFLDPSEIYACTDYCKFNENFAEKYNTFKKFADKCGLYIEPYGYDVQDFKPHIPCTEDKELIKYQAGLCQLNQTIVFKPGIDGQILPFKPGTANLAKKVVFVAHEFGLFTGHGGIASYLYSMCKYLLENTNYSINVIAGSSDKNCDLLRFENFTVFDISKGDLNKKRNKVLDICKTIQPNYVECADFHALGLHLVLDKSNGKNFQDTVIVTNNHTATKECFEWSTVKDFRMDARADDQAISMQEEIQMKYSDYCIAPSSFLAKYVKKNYGLKDDILVFSNPLSIELKSKEKIVANIQEQFEFDILKKSFNITLISRFEGRKNQVRLVSAVETLLSKGINCRLFLVGNTSKIPGTCEDYRIKVFRAINQKYRNKIMLFDFMDAIAQEKILAITDMVVMPSTFENQPMSMVEAIKRGIPAIGSKYSGLADYSPAEMLFDPFNKAEPFLCINSFLEKSEEERVLLASMQRMQLECFINPEMCILPRFRLEPKGRTTDDIFVFNLDLSEKVS